MPLITWDFLCPDCRYNLRGLEQQHRCPECGQAYDATLPSTRYRYMTGLSAFDKLCAVLATIVALPLLILGLLGLFTGCSANFSLPPILGVIPALVAWGIFRCVLVAWRATHFVNAAAALTSPRTIPSIYRDPVPRSAEPIDREIDRRRAEEGFELPPGDAPDAPS